jgi:DNA helicase-2/ATP-dependent DNA helicase PcrA
MTQPIPILNDTQQQAVSAGDGPALVLAGAGSGKTRVIVERLAWLVSERGVDARHLLALTFTNKAAGEMRERVAERLGTDRFGAWVGTFHSFGLFLLRRFIDRLGRNTNFTIFDDADQLALMKRLVKDLPANYLRVSPRDALHWISSYKHSLETPEKGEEGYESDEEEAYALLWTRYHDALLNASAVDFDDLLVLPARILTEHEEVRTKLQGRYQYVHVDEYQDTNHAQYVIAKELSTAHGNLFVVGDEDQSIYSWRGADIQNILDFEEDFPDAKVIRLEQNYRSTAPILKAANAVVKNNEQRLGKTLWTDVKTGEPVRFYDASDGEDEARYVVSAITDRELESRKVAVLYRTNSQSRLMEEALARAGMAAVVVGGVRFYARKEVKDLLAYLRILVNPRDDVALRRIINVPTRGIGATTLQQLDGFARLREQTLMEVLRDVEHDETISGRARKSVTDFVHLIDDFTVKAESESVADLVEAILEETGYREFIKSSDEKDARSRLEIVDEFVAACAEHDASDGGPVAEFLQELALVSDVDSLDEDTPAVTLMTCHSAKGLEFDHVFLIGLEEGLLPHASSIHDDDEVEEERRLCYVAMTRARRSLTLVAAQSRRIYGERRAADVSRFLGEIPAACLEHVARPKATGQAAKAPAKSSAPTSADELKMGTRVLHAKFGKGSVMFTKGSGEKLRARIRFENGRTREFMMSAAPIRILKGKGS